MPDFLTEKTPQIDPLTRMELRAMRAEHKLAMAMTMVRKLNRNNSILIKQVYHSVRVTQWAD